MKKSRMNKKGFTLLEITIVIAIIVILAAAVIIGVPGILNRSTHNAELVRLHASGGKFWKVVNGEVIEVSLDEYEANQDDPSYDCGGEMDFMNAEVKYIGGSIPYSGPPSTYTPGGGAGDPGGGGTPGDLPGGGGTPGGGGGASNPTSMPSMLEDFFDYYGIPHNGTDVEDGFNINDPSLFGGRTYTEAWEDWVAEHTNKPTTAPEPTTPPEPTKAPDPTATPIPSPTDAPSSGAVTVPSTVTSGTGVKQYTNNSDGTTTVTLVLNTHNTGDVKIRKEADGNYSIYCVGQDGHTVVGNVIGYTTDNQWCTANTWIKLTPSDWNKLSSTYGFH